MPHDVDADDEQRKGLLTPLARVSGDRRQIVLPTSVPDRAREPRAPGGQVAGTLNTDIRNIRSIPACVAPTETPRGWIVRPSIRRSSWNELSTCRAATTRSGRQEEFSNQHPLVDHRISCQTRQVASR